MRRIRESLGLSQQGLAQELGMSIGSIRAWENSDRFSEAAQVKLTRFCLQNNRPDYAIELSDRRFTARPVFENQERLANAPSRTTATSKDLAEVLHGAVDLVLEKGAPDLIAAVQAVLILASNLLRTNTSTSTSTNVPESSGEKMSRL